MKSLHLFLTLFGLLLWSTLSRSADLLKMDRMIQKEPAYKTKPSYCLLVFGSEAKFRAWLVVDGDTLYIDRHGDGDLTHFGDKLKVHRTETSPNPLASGATVFLDVKPEGDQMGRGAPTLRGTSRYTRLWLSRAHPKQNGVATDDHQAEYLDHLRHNYTAVSLRIDDTYNQLGWACFSESPQEAPILHFDGPLTLGFGQNFGRFKPKFVRGSNTEELVVNLETVGVGKGAVVTMDNRYPPPDIHPTAEIKFSGKKPGGKPIMTRVILKERC